MATSEKIDKESLEHDEISKRKIMGKRESSWGESYSRKEPGGKEGLHGSQ